MIGAKRVALLLVMVLSGCLYSGSDFSGRSFRTFMVPGQPQSRAKWITTPSDLNDVNSFRSPSAARKLHRTSPATCRLFASSRANPPSAFTPARLLGALGQHFDDDGFRACGSFSGCDRDCEFEREPVGFQLRSLLRWSTLYNCIRIGVEHISRWRGS